MFQRNHLKMSISQNLCPLNSPRLNLIASRLFFVNSYTILLMTISPY
jgi:hypothetical protein